MSAPSITDTLFRLSREDPTRVFCVHYSHALATPISWRALHDSAASVAGALQSLGCVGGDVAFLFIRHDPTLYAAFVGCMMHGVTPALMPYPNPKQNPAAFWASHRSLLNRVKPRLLVVSEAFLADFAQNLPEYADLLQSAEQLSKAAPAVIAAGQATEIAFLQHSSGTTANKKGVMLTHSEVLKQINAYSRSLNFNESDIIASWLPLYHDMGLISCFMMTLVTGSTLIALDPFEWVSAPGSLFEVIERHRATFCWLPNFAFNHLVNSVRPRAAYDLSSLKAFINCSEPCKAETFRLFAERFAPYGIGPSHLQVCYAMAENVFAVTQTPFGAISSVIKIDREAFEKNRSVIPGDDFEILSCGRQIDSVEVRIISEDGLDFPEDKVGEIVIRSPFLFSGYHKLPERTALVLRGGWYHTGDLGFLHNGELYVTGRRDDLLIAYGRNYYAHEIESLANNVEGIIPGRCVAFTVPSDLFGTNLVVLVAETNMELSRGLERRIRETVLIGSGLALNQIELQKPGWLIKTTSGKISRDANRRRFLERNRGLGNGTR